MSAIKSLDDLKRIREEALEKRKLRTSSSGIQMIVAMGTCGIAAGARDTMKAILNQIEEGNLSGIVVSQTGCIGLCEKEPIVQVVIGDSAKVTYGKVTPELAEKIIKEHVLGGNIVKEHVVETA
jgi:NADP-reducing hydrogenase subunit HndB